MSTMRGFWNDVVGQSPTDAAWADAPASDAPASDAPAADAPAADAPAADAPAADAPAIVPLTPGKDISVTFKNNYGDSRYWWIQDLKRDPNVPYEVFQGYLDDQQTITRTLLGDSTGNNGQVRYKRSDGPWYTQSNISGGNTVNMS